jgi:hypothetical protein
VVGIGGLGGMENQREPSGEVEDLGHQEPGNLGNDDGEYEGEESIGFGSLLSAFIQSSDFNDSRLDDVLERGGMNQSSSELQRSTLLTKRPGATNMAWKVANSRFCTDA